VSEKGMSICPTPSLHNGQLCLGHVTRGQLLRRRRRSAATTPATVQTDKRAHLPDSQVIATGGGWSNNAVVALTYTEIATTDPNGVLNGPVTATGASTL